MLDRLEDAWAVALPADEHARELGSEAASEHLAHIATLAGDDAGAAGYLRRACDRYEAAGNTPVLSTYAPLLGRVLCAVGRHDEAETLAATGRELGDPQDVMTQTFWRETEALLRSHAGEHAEAERLAGEAVEWTERSDSLETQGDSFSILAQVLEAAGRRDEAVAAWQEALDRYERKGIVPLARRVRERLAALEPA
jgi:tetratricopeptide (TPR) repeat protein